MNSLLTHEYVARKSLLLLMLATILSGIMKSIWFFFILNVLPSMVTLARPFRQNAAMQSGNFSGVLPNGRFSAERTRMKSSCSLSP